MGKVIKFIILKTENINKKDKNRRRTISEYCLRRIPTPVL